LKRKVNKEDSLDNRLKTLIHLDIKRSFPYSKAVTFDSLLNLLTTYAYSNTKVQYCQGMNFIAGFLLVITKNGSMAFKILKTVIEDYELQDLFIQDALLLKRKFYQLDRLINNKYPDIGKLFRMTGVTSTLYGSPWIMTIFTRSMQLTNKDQPSEMLMRIWDFFLLDKWKAIFKAALFFVDEVSCQLMDADLEKILATFSSISNGEIFHDSLAAEKFTKRYKEIRLTNHTLDNLKTEYGNIFNNINNVLNQTPS